MSDATYYDHGNSYESGKTEKSLTVCARRLTVKSIICTRFGNSFVSRINPYDVLPTRVSVVERLFASLSILFRRRTSGVESNADNKRIEKRYFTRPPPGFFIQPFRKRTSNSKFLTRTGLITFDGDKTKNTSTAITFVRIIYIYTRRRRRYFGARVVIMFFVRRNVFTFEAV